ncbi:LysR family transcriptional regulator [Paracoccus sp. 1_MG-2023]|uniref:LysR family transcriptional regulator n=1 Tax=unclassified Paracoccus (in: a-proteobacteria) TaxID=2688777 RepID=UPI001C08C899|nr:MULTISPECIES: LysR family transcriptional regulator [unclassified Paracoccus (in: a-proteobacteria)]MBU2957566.1 LysR family transcriptional regulator [Paracoccus sp. C2R09]MDO6669774.1 LysR family transcriptional regulator [Paracoccus sp. 1_MG-2023]
MPVETWDDIRVALAVARHGTVSGAAGALGVHHATVIRRIDALEAALRTRLFQRHARGYALTETGRAMLAAGAAAEERFAQMAAQIEGAGDRVEGQLTVTSLPGLADLVMPRLIGLMRRHPGLRVNYAPDLRLLRLDAGEAHVAIRAGARPTEPDYVVRAMGSGGHALFATADYMRIHGPIDDLDRHRFALPAITGALAPSTRWLLERLRPENILLTAPEDDARESVIRAGLAVGILPPGRGAGLEAVMQLPEWDADLWLVTHVDLHRTPKVQAALRALREPD